LPERKESKKRIKENKQKPNKAKEVNITEAQELQESLASNNMEKDRQKSPHLTTGFDCKTEQTNYKKAIQKQRSPRHKHKTPIPP